MEETATNIHQSQSENSNHDRKYHEISVDPLSSTMFYPISLVPISLVLSDAPGGPKLHPHGSVPNAPFFMGCCNTLFRRKHGLNMLNFEGEAAFLF